MKHTHHARLASMLMVLALLATLSAGGATSLAADVPNLNKTGLPVVQEPITLTGMVNLDPKVPDWNTHPFSIELEARTNIHVEYECVSAEGFAERRNLAFASNLLPDFIMRAGLSAAVEAKYAAAQQIIALDPYFEDYAPYFSAVMEANPGVFKNIAQPNGHIYAMPQLNTTEGNLVDKNWINQAWLEKLGLPMPTTIDEFYDTLVAFRDGDPNQNGKADEIPFSVNMDTAAALLRNFFGCWGFAGNNGILNQPSYLDVDDDGNVRLIPTDPRFREMLAYFNKLWDEKLLDREVFSQAQPQVVAKVDADTVGFSPFGNNQQWMGTKRDYFVAAPAFASEYSDGVWYAMNPLVQVTGTFVITSANKHPEITMRWVDYFYSEEGTLLVRMGILGTSCYYDEETDKYELMPEIKNDPSGLTLDQALGKWAVFAGGNVPQMIVDKVDASAAQLPEIKAATEVLRPFMISFDAIPRLKYTEEETMNLGRYATDIQNFIEENVVKFITGERPLTEYDAFISSLESMNLSEYLAIHQASFDRWKSN